MYLTNTPASSFTSRQADDKLPHDASVFVGSLPSNIDQGDLTRMLMEHLSEHTQIKNIKVVRDSKGGVCAFVQCESAASANALIQTLHSSVPKPFLGRILRYEPARAFRSLIISYRTPTQFVAPPEVNTTLSSPVCNEVELDLPFAMRVWKQRNSKFHNILYNSEAIQSEESHNRMAGGPHVDSLLFLHPLKFDQDTLHRLVSYFGPLEKFGLLECPGLDGRSFTYPLKVFINIPPYVDADSESPASSKAVDCYPEPHRAPRSPSMDSSCWEIKWEHRDDCVSALMTLKRVPHLTVTWAHQPAVHNYMNRLNHHQELVPQSWPLHTPPRSSATHSPMRGFHASPISKQLMEEGQSSLPSTGHVPGDSRNEINPYARAYESNFNAQGPDAPATKSDRASQEGSGSLLSSPLRAREDEREHKISNSDPHSASPRRLNDISERGAFSDDFLECGVQELHIPQTPALDPSTITPLTPGSHFPLTPTSSGSDLPPGALRKGIDMLDGPMSFQGLDPNHPNREIDPTTLFVGGLEMFGPGAWDEEKVKKFFARFGGLESVKLVRPVNGCAAFAFVKFDNAESPARAVSEEHNRVYEGRSLRVQLRDCNPPKNNWKYGRGRGRPQHHFNAPRRYNYRSSSSIERNAEGPAFHQNPQVASKFQLSSLADALPAIDRTPGNDGVSVFANSPSMEKSPDSLESPVNEKYREWYDNVETSTRTPEPASITSSASTTSLPFAASPYAYSVPNGPFLPPPPWMQPYSPHGPYQMPYYPGYPIYPSTVSPQTHSTLATPPGSDIGSPSTPVQPHWPTVGMYASYIPYPSVQASQGQMTHPQMGTQAPVVPSGFIQNEQGTLIAVYQPEVLDQYLAGSRQPPASITQFAGSGQTHEVSHMSPAQFTALNGRPKGPPQQFSAQKRENRRPFHAAASPFHQRQAVDRRENHHGFNSVRQPRSFGNGHPNRGQIHPAQMHANPGHQGAQPAMPGDWNEWNNTR